MTQEQIFGLLRAILTIAGTYLFGHNIFGNKIDESLWQEIAGAVLVAASFVWTFVSKTLTLEIFQSSILKIVMVFGGLLVTSGKVTGATLQAWVAFLTALIPIVYSFLSKAKSKAIAEGDIKTRNLSQ